MAHEARPAYLELTETLPDRYDVVWRTPVSAGQRLPVVLQLPDGVRTIVEPRLREFADSVVERRIIAVPGGLGGKRVEFVGLQATITDVLVRVETRDGARCDYARSSLAAVAGDRPSPRILRRRRCLPLARHRAHSSWL